MLDAVRRNSLGASLALHALLVAALSFWGMSKAPRERLVQDPITISVVTQPARPEAARAPDRPPRPAQARQPNPTRPQAPVPAKPDLEAAIAAERAARRRAEAERLGAVGASQGSELPSGVAEPGQVRGDLSGRTLVLRVEPHYPEGARRDGAEGEVLLQVVVTPAGAVSEAGVVARSGDARLDQAALAAVRQWRFSALPQDLAQVDQTGAVPIRFRLR